MLAEKKPSNGTEVTDECGMVLRDCGIMAYPIWADIQITPPLSLLDDLRGARDEGLCRLHHPLQLLQCVPEHPSVLSTTSSTTSALLLALCGYIKA